MSSKSKVIKFINKIENKINKDKLLLNEFIFDNHFGGARKELRQFRSAIRRVINDGEDINFIDIDKKKWKIILSEVKKQRRNIVLELINHAGNITFITITPYNVDDYVEYLKPQMGVDDDSMVVILESVISAQSIREWKPKEEVKKKRVKAKFFKYYHKIDGLDLTDFQIFRNEDELNTENSCLIHSLISAGLDESKIENAKCIVKTRDFPMCRLNELCENLDIYITVRRLDANKKLDHFGDKSKEEIKLAIIDEHYFYIKDKIPITSYALLNYEEVKNEKNFNLIYQKSNNKYIRRKDRFISSYDVIKILFENKDNLLTPISNCNKLYETCYFDKIDNITTLSYEESNSMPNEKMDDKKIKKNEKKRKNFINIFADFETRTDGVHIPYLVKCHSVKKTFYGEECGLHMLFYLTKKYHNTNLRLIFHNAGYDIRFIQKYLYNLKLIERGKFLLRGYGRFKNIKIEIQDSYALIPDKLEKFPKIFGIKNHIKEVIPYDLYTQENVEKQFIDYDTCIKYVKMQFRKKNIGKPVIEKEENEYIELYNINLERWDCIEDGKVDIIKYSKEYCNIDVLLLEKGYNKFNKWINDITGLYLDDYVSLPSLANQYMMEEGVYDDVYMISGIPREFIQKCMVGGRTMCSENKKKLVNTSYTTDLDAKSLYPSAMKRLSDELGGILKGKPKVLENLSYNFLKKQDGYFIEIEIVNVPKKYKFPLMSYITKDGIRNFSNEMEGKKIYVDKISLEDIISFHKLDYKNGDFKILRGYYYNEGRNDNIGEVISYLFNERIKAEEEGNPIEKVFKLLMNSAYGKSLLKPIDEEDKYIRADRFDVYMQNNYAWIKFAELLPNERYYKVRVRKPINEHYNNCQVGIEILSMSKRIMNEVMTLAEDNNIDIYYQDTDSMHLEYDKVQLLSDKFYEKYGRVLQGENMGQFNLDFKSDILDKEKPIVAKWSIFLGKKCYIDVLINIDNPDIIDYHIRLKGVSNDSILHYCKINDITPYELFEMLYNKKSIEFDLNCNGLKKNFVFNYNMTITNNPKFTRTIKF